MSHNIKFTRRQAIINGVAGVAGLHAAGKILDFSGKIVPFQNPILEAARRSIRTGVALADTPRMRPVFAIAVMDKVTSWLIHYVEGDKANTNGFNAMRNNAVVSWSGDSVPLADVNGPLANRAVNWNGIAWSGVWGDLLSTLDPNKYGAAMFTCVNSRQGGHNAGDVNLRALNKASLRYQLTAEGISKGILVPAFSYSGDAISHVEYHTAPGGGSLDLMESPAKLYTMLKQAHGSLSLPKEFADFRSQLDIMASNDASVRAKLGDLRDKIEPALPQMLTAIAAGDDIMKQVNAGIVAVKSGMADQAFVAIGTDDTNGGGDATNPGGDMGICPYQAWRAAAWAVKTILTEVPDAIVYFLSEGGRSANGGDASIAMIPMFGPADVIKSGYIGSIPTMAQLGNQTSEVPIMLSNAKAASPSRVGWDEYLATVLRAVGGNTEGLIYVPGALVKG